MNSLNELTNVTRSGTFTVAGATTTAATNVTVNTTNAIRYADYTFAATNLTVTNGVNTFTAVAKDALGNVDTNVSIGNLPAPDDQLTTKLNAAYMVATAAGDDCYNGASGGTRLMERSAAERTRTLAQLAAAVDYVRSVTGHTPTTDTTAPQGGGDPFAGGN